MPFRSAILAAAAFAGAALAAPAPAAARDADGLLAALPIRARAGVCYAHVRAPARFAPPAPPHGRWVLRPGSPGPLWCLEMEPGAPPAMIAPERLGWIRVVCDADRTPARVSLWQRRLRERGDYAGEVSGRYDEATSLAVSRFQHGRHLDHGGYLSMTTVEMIERSELGGGAGGYGAPAAPLSRPCLQGCGADIPPPPPPVVTIPVPPPGWDGRPHGLAWPGKIG